MTKWYATRRKKGTLIYVPSRDRIGRSAILGRDQESDGLCRQAMIDRITDAQRSAVHNIIINVRWKGVTGEERRVDG